MKNSKENVNYSTQKTMKQLIERIIKASTDEGDIVADFFLWAKVLPVLSMKKWVENGLEYNNSKLSKDTTKNNKRSDYSRKYIVNM